MMALKPLTRLPLRCVHASTPNYGPSLLFRPELSFIKSSGNILKQLKTGGLKYSICKDVSWWVEISRPVTVGAPERRNLHVQLNRRGLLTFIRSSELETSASELPAAEHKPPRKPRKRPSKPTTWTHVVQSSPLNKLLQDPGLEVEIWSRLKNWVVFSDLHVSRRTLETCLQVLRAVHAEATSRDAGIIFLGDFWHARGALPVELLNVVVAEVGKWSRPAIFIPGNHDQVNMGGQMHALMVLGAVNPLIRVFDEPVEFLGALWLPFRRDHNLINQALQQHCNVKAIFAHLDVVGAFMNEACQAKEGIEPSIFPENIPVFTGHYHKPHVVDKTQIEYIGSPYQISASETGQGKRFLLLNNSWEKIGSIPIDIGGRHFVIPHIEESDLENLQYIRTGDRLRLLLSTTLLDEKVKTKLDDLQSRGVHVDLVFPTLSAKPRIEEAEHLNAFGLFNLYSERVAMSAGAIKKGAEILQRMDFPPKLIQRPQAGSPIR